MRGIGGSSAKLLLTVKLAGIYRRTRGYMAKYARSAPHQRQLGRCIETDDKLEMSSRAFVAKPVIVRRRRVAGGMLSSRSMGLAHSGLVMPAHHSLVIPESAFHDVLEQIYLRRAAHLYSAQLNLTLALSLARVILWLYAYSLTSGFVTPWGFLPGAAKDSSFQCISVMTTLGIDNTSSDMLGTTV